MRRYFAEFINLFDRFHKTAKQAEKDFGTDGFAEIVNGKLKLHKQDRLEIPNDVNRLQSTINSYLPKIKIEQLLIEVDQMTGFTKHFTPIHGQKSKPQNFFKGEHRHGLSRWIFFANQGKFQVGDYEEIMNKASCLSLVSNAVLYWNTVKISKTIDELRNNGEQIINDEKLSHISLLAYKHVIPMGTYFQLFLSNGIF